MCHMTIHNERCPGPPSAVLFSSRIFAVAREPWGLSPPNFCQILTLTLWRCMARNEFKLARDLPTLRKFQRQWIFVLFHPPPPLLDHGDTLGLFLFAVHTEIQISSTYFEAPPFLCPCCCSTRIDVFESFRISELRTIPVHILLTLILLHFRFHFRILHIQQTSATADVVHLSILHHVQRSSRCFTDPPAQ